MELVGSSCAVLECLLGGRFPQERKMKYYRRWFKSLEVIVMGKSEGDVGGGDFLSRGGEDMGEVGRKEGVEGRLGGIESLFSLPIRIHRTSSKSI